MAGRRVAAGQPTTVRFQADICNIVESWSDGKNFTEKLHSIIRFSNDEVPRAEKQLAQIKAKIQEENQRYYAAMAKMRKFQSLRNLIEDLERMGERAAKQMYAVIEQDEQDVV